MKKKREKGGDKQTPKSQKLSANRVVLDLSAFTDAELPKSDSLALKVISVDHENLESTVEVGPGMNELMKDMPDFGPVTLQSIEEFFVERFSEHAAHSAGLMEQVKPEYEYPSALPSTPIVNQTPKEILHAKVRAKRR